MDNNATMTAEEAAVILGIGRNAVYTLARKGQLPGGRYLGKRLIVLRSVLEQFLEGELVHGTILERPVDRPDAALVPCK